MVEAYARAAGVELRHFPRATWRPRWHFAREGYEAADALPTDRPITVIATEGSWPMRQWPRERFAAVARWLQRYFRVIEVGSPTAALNVGWDLCGKTTLQQLAALYSHASLAVMCDSLHVHLAACFQTPTVGIWGGTNPAYRIHGPEHRVVQKPDFPCMGCHHLREAPRCHSVCDRGVFRGLRVPMNGCMDIPVEAVISAIENVLETR
jgi:ADP-heptose:LPS heptosyltransferase